MITQNIILGLSQKASGSQSEGYRKDPEKEFEDNQIIEEYEGECEECEREVQKKVCLVCEL